MAVYCLAQTNIGPAPCISSISIKVAGDSNHRHASADVAVGGGAVLRLGAGVPGVSAGAHPAARTAAAAAAAAAACCTAQRSDAAPKLLLERGADAPPMLLGVRRTAAQDAVAAGSSKGKRGGKGGGQRRVLDVPLLLPVVVASAAGLPLLVRRFIRWLAPTLQILQWAWQCHRQVYLRFDC